MKQLSKEQIARRYYLAQHRERTNIPVVLVPGTEPPTLKGRPWHYTTAGGTRITYPNAYSKRGWSNMIYRYSTLHLVVGEDWVPPET